MARLVPREREQQRIDQHAVVPVPPILEEIADVVRLVLQARVQRIDEQTVNVPIPHLTEDIVEDST